jgi:hypothetical protein
MATAAPSTRKLLVNRRDAARMLGMSVDSFRRHVEPDCRIVRVGSMRLIPVRELEVWIENHAAQLPEGFR